MPSPPHPPALVQDLLSPAPLAPIAEQLRSSLVCGLRYAGRRTVNLAPPGFFGRIRGAVQATPQLSVINSKIGGVPYREAADPEDTGIHFLAQLNFAELDTADTDLPDAGLIAFDAPPDEPFCVRWYPDACPELALPARPDDLHSWEHRLETRASWSFDFAPMHREIARLSQARTDGEIDDAAFEVLDEACREAARWLYSSGAMIGGYLPAGISGPGARHWLTAPPDPSARLRELIRLEDPGCNLQFGDLNVSVVIAETDLRSGDLHRSHVLCWR